MKKKNKKIYTSLLLLGIIATQQTSLDAMENEETYALNTLQWLPVEARASIYSLLPGEALAACRFVCRQFNEEITAGTVIVENLKGHSDRIKETDSDAFKGHIQILSEEASHYKSGFGYYADFLFPLKDSKKMKDWSFNYGGTESTRPLTEVASHLYEVGRIYQRVPYALNPKSRVLEYFFLSSFLGDVNGFKEGEKIIAQALPQKSSKFQDFVFLLTLGDENGLKGLEEIIAKEFPQEGLEFQQDVSSQNMTPSKDIEPRDPKKLYNIAEDLIQKRDFHMAARFFHKAAHLGDSKSFWRLALLLMGGIASPNVKIDPPIPGINDIDLQKIAFHHLGERIYSDGTSWTDMISL